MAGETCMPNPPRSDCVTAIAEMQKFHWSFLNILYNPNVINRWKKSQTSWPNGCLTAIQNRLGYRFELINGTYPKTARVNSTLKIQISLNNTGFASLFNPRNAYIILKNTVTSVQYSFVLKTNPLFWQPGAVLNINESINVPANISPGNYKINLNLPDSSPLVIELNIRFVLQMQMYGKQTLVLMICFLLLI